MEAIIKMITLYKTTNRFVPLFTLHPKYRTINLNNATYTISKYRKRYKTRFSPRNINMKSSISHNLHFYNTRLHIITPHNMRVIVPKHQTRFAIPNIIIPEMCFSSGSLTSKPDPCDRAPMGVGSHTMNRGKKGRGNVTYLDGHTALPTKPVPVRSNPRATNSRLAPHQEHNLSLVRLPKRRKYPYKNAK